MVPVIEYVDEGNKIYQIGHSNSSSMTFLPNFHVDNETKTLFIDIAGLNDTNGPKIEIFNQLITKYIFTRVGPTKLIIPGKLESFNDARGKGFRSMLKLLQNIFRGSLDKFGFSLHPIFTQAKPNAEFELENYQSDFR